MDIQASVIGQITQSPTRNGGTKFNVPLSDGNTYSTFEYAVAAKASQAGASVATYRVVSKPSRDGSRMYHNLEAVALQGEQLPPELPQAGTPIAQGAVGGQVAFPGAGAAQQPQQAFPAAPSGGGGMSLEDKIRVTKLSCIGSAAELLSGSGDVDALFDVAQRIFTAVMQPPAQQQQTAASAEAVAQVAAEPAAVAQFVAEQAGQPLVAVGTESLPQVQQPAEAAGLPWATA